MIRAVRFSSSAVTTGLVPSVETGSQTTRDRCGGTADRVPRWRRRCIRGTASSQDQRCPDPRGGFASGRHMHDACPAIENFVRLIAQGHLHRYRARGHGRFREPHAADVAGGDCPFSGDSPRTLARGTVPPHGSRHR